MRPTGVLTVPLLCLALGACNTTSLRQSFSPAPTMSASIVAALNGGLIGGDLGRSIGDRDRRRGLEAEYTALEHTPAGRAVGWTSDGGRWSGEVIAAQPYRVGSQDCRQYRHRLIDGGRQTEARGTACRNPDGSWTLLS